MSLSPRLVRRTSVRARSSSPGALSKSACGGWRFEAAPLGSPGRTPCGSGDSLRRGRWFAPLLVGLLWIACVAAPPASHGAGDLLTTEEEVSVDADSVSYDQRTDTIVATGHVVIRRGQSELHADEVRLDRRTNDAEAVGNVSVTDPEGVIFAESLRLNFDAETGALVQARLQSLRLGYSLSGARIEKGLGQRYHIEDGRFTTCRCADGAPSWSIASRTLDVTLEGYGSARDATFNVLDVPVLYFPHLVFPVNRDRQSGLLLPRVGLSNRRGFQLVQPFYWAIDKSRDATVALDVETSARLGLVGEYRYAASRDLEGKINASYFNEQIRGTASESSSGENNDPDVPKNRWGVLGEHRQGIGPVEAYADLMLAGDNLFLREINTLTVDQENEVSLRTRAFTDSRVGFIRRWERAYLQGEGTYYQDLVDTDALVLQRAPEVRFGAQKQLGLGLLGRMNVSLTDFQRPRGIAGGRFDLQPGVEWALPLGRSFFGHLRATFRETAYALTEDEMTGGFRGDGVGVTDPASDLVDLPAQATRESVELGGEVHTSVSRVFDFGYFGVEKLRHTIEPGVEYLYLPDVDQGDVMVFDGLDRLGERNLFTYGVASRLLARNSPERAATHGAVSELCRVSVSQSYDLSRSIAPDSVSRSNEHLSDIDMAVRIQPTRKAAIRMVSSFDTGEASFSAATLGVQLREPIDPGAGDGWMRLLRRSTIGMAYRFVVDNPLDLPASECESGTCGLQQFDTSMLVWLRDTVGFRYANRYNIRESSFLENYYGLRLLSSCDCWKADLGIVDKANPNEVELRLQVTLTGFDGGGL